VTPEWAGESTTRPPDEFPRARDANQELALTNIGSNGLSAGFEKPLRDAVTDAPQLR